MKALKIITFIIIGFFCINPSYATNYYEKRFTDIYGENTTNAVKDALNGFSNSKLKALYHKLDKIHNSGQQNRSSKNIYVVGFLYFEIGNILNKEFTSISEIEKTKTLIKKVDYVKGDQTLYIFGDSGGTDLDLYGCGNIHMEYSGSLYCYFYLGKNNNQLEYLGRYGSRDMYAVTSRLNYSISGSGSEETYNANLVLFDGTRSSPIGNITRILNVDTGEITETGLMGQLGGGYYEHYYSQFLEK